MEEKVCENCGGDGAAWYPITIDPHNPRSEYFTCHVCLGKGFQPRSKGWINISPKEGMRAAKKKIKEYIGAKR